jgi:putative oxidoreductase
MLPTTRNGSISELTVWAPPVLAILRIVSALLLIDQGLTTLLHFPQAGVPDALDAGAGAIEVMAGVLIAVGLCTRAAALAAAAETAMAYGAFDRPDTAILFCAIFFYLVFAGPGLWSLDGRIHRPGLRPEVPRSGAAARHRHPVVAKPDDAVPPGRVTPDRVTSATTVGKVLAERPHPRACSPSHPIHA